MVNIAQKPMKAFQRGRNPGQKRDEDGNSSSVISFAGSFLRAAKPILAGLFPHLINRLAHKLQRRGDD
jgi:hypothetical protein